MCRQVLIFIAASFLASATTPGSMKLSVVLNLDQKSYSPQALESMQAEAASIFRNSGLELDWTLLNRSNESPEFGELVIFKMTGKCAMDSFPLVPDEMGLPLARTHSTNGEMLSFGEVHCDRVRDSVKRTLLPSDYGRGNEVLGRALGRVLAHEVYHMLTRSRMHADAGVSKQCLSSHELTGNRFPFSDKSLSAIREQIALIKKHTAVVLPPVSLP